MVMPYSRLVGGSSFIHVALNGSRVTGRPQIQRRRDLPTLRFSRRSPVLPGRERFEAGTDEK